MVPSSAGDPSFATFAVSSIPQNTIIYHRLAFKPIPIKLLPTRKASLGQLGVFASELLLLIINHIDLQSLAELRLSSHCLKSFIDETVEYDRIRRHGSNAMRAMKESRTLGYHTLSSVFRALTSKFCAFCGEFGPCLSVLTCDRCCLNCIARHPALRLIPTSYAPRFYVLSKDQLKTTRRMEIIPGRYRCRAYAGTLTSTRPGEALMLAADIDAKAIAFHGSRENMEQQLIERTHQEHDPASHFPPIIAPIFAHHPIQDPNYNAPRDGFYPSALDGFRFAGSVEFPVLRKGADQIEPAFWCTACRYEFDVMHPAHSGDWSNWFRRWPKDYATAYDEDQFLKHLQICENAQGLSQTIEAGTEDFEEGVYS